MRRFKGLAILMTVAMLTLLFASMVFATTTNTPSKIQNFDVDIDNDVPITLTNLSITEPEDEPETFEEDKSFTITLSDGVQFQDEDDYGDDDATTFFAKVTTETDNSWSEVDDVTEYVEITRTGDQTLDVKFVGDHTSEREKISIALKVYPDDPEEGDITAEIDDLGTAVTGDSKVVARFVDSNCAVTVSDKDTVSEDGGELGQIKISENSIGAIGASDNDYAFKVTLPSDFDWADDMTDEDNYRFTGGLSECEIVDIEIDGNDLFVAFNIPDGDRNQRGAIEFSTYVDPDNSADMGDIEVTVDGENEVNDESYEEADIDSTDIVIGEYSDYDVKTYADDDVEEVIAGQEDQDLTTLKIDEGIAASLLQNRKIQVDFPDYVRITEVDVKGASTIIDGEGTIDEDEDCSSWYVKTEDLSSSSKDIEVDFTVSIAADAPAGDITAKISGSAGAEGEVVIGKIVKPISVETDIKDISLGDKEQVCGNIIIKENTKEAILDDEDLLVVLPEGVKWASEPKVEVTEGNLNIDDVDIDDTDNTDDTLTISIDSKSSKPSTITITGVELTVDRTVPFGNIVAKFKGKALAENYTSFDSLDDDEEDEAKAAGKFDTSTAAKAAVANLTTPPVDNSGIFYIGSTVYSENGSMKVMDAAPYIKSDRTYVPVRYLAYMLGVTEANVTYDEATKTVSIKKDNKEVQLVIGSTTIMVNGEAKTMDVAPEITNDRTFLPARYVAEGLGYTVGWNPTTQSVIISK